MKALERVATVVALGLVAGVLWAPHPARAKAPVVVELFTAQGCAPCAQANVQAAKIADRPGVIVLTWSVEYWDYLGWKDTFAQPAFTVRQKAYARRLGPRDVYTPQVVVNGSAQASGDDSATVTALLRKAEAVKRRPLKIRMQAGGRIGVGSGSVGRGPADVWLVRFDPRQQDVSVTAGDNRGVTMVERNVVRQIVRLGAWTGHATTYRAPPASESGLASAVIVQSGHGGRVIGAMESVPRKPKAVSQKGMSGR